MQVQAVQLEVPGYKGTQGMHEMPTSKDNNNEDNNNEDNNT